MAAVNSCAWTEVILSLYFISVSGCPPNTNVFTTTGSSATIQYDGNSLPDKTSTYKITDPQGSVRAQFTLTSTLPQVLNLTFTGSIATGDLSFRIDNIRTPDTGVYQMVAGNDVTPLLCNTVYITGSLSVPSLTSKKSPSVGESVTLTCSSSSTTVPAGLPLVYIWQADGATNPVESRYMYSTSRDTLTVSDVHKSDADKVFTCKAQEEGSKITSSSSSHFRINVLFSSCASNTRVFNNGSSVTLQYNINALPKLIVDGTYLVEDPQGRARVQFTVRSWQINGDVQTVDIADTEGISTGNLSFRIDDIQTQDSGVYKMIRVSDTSTPLLCNTVYITGSLSVPTLTSDKSLSVRESVTLTCSSSSTTVPAGLPLVYTWQVDGTTDPVHSRYTYSSSRASLTVSGVEKSDADKLFTCMGQEEGSNIASNSSCQFMIVVLYAPTIAITKTQSDVTECTNRLILTCNVSSNPVSMITWYRGQQLLTTTGGSNVSHYSITNVDRTMSGQYRCVANNGQGGNVQETETILVNYAPDVFVMTRNVTTQDQSVDIVCNASGVPEQYTFSPWTHQWDITGQVLKHPGLGISRVLRLTNLTYEHSGIYTCAVNNGVDCNGNQGAGTGHANLIVKAAPVLIYPQTEVNTERIRLSTKVTQFAVFTFTFWSNADNTAVTCYRNINGTRQDTPVGNTVFTKTTVMLPVFSSSIATTGTMATLSLNIGDVEDLGAYDVVLSNQIGEGKLLAIDVVLQETSIQDVSHINEGVVAGSIVGAFVALIIVGICIFLYSRVECSCSWKKKPGKQVDDALQLNDRSNVDETPIQDAIPDHVYSDLDQPVLRSSTGQAAGSNEYEQPVSISKPEHVYTDLQHA